jgi:hypothetical protein
MSNAAEVFVNCLLSSFGDGSAKMSFSSSTHAMGSSFEKSSLSIGVLSAPLCDSKSLLKMVSSSMKTRRTALPRAHAPFPHAIGPQLPA